MVIIIMGVAGSGKTTVGRMLASRLAIPFHDADDYHSVQSIEKMRTGIPLDDRDRTSWLAMLATLIAQWNRGKGAVLACSALKESYRHTLTAMGKEEVTFVCLLARMELIQQRLAEREGHFFNPDLLQSQYDSLEIPADAITVDSEQPPDIISMRLAENLQFFLHPFDPAGNSVHNMQKSTKRNNR